MTEADVLSMVKNYKEEMVDLTIVRWSPTLCRQMPEVEMSCDRTDQAHGRKLYALFTTHAPDYFAIASDELDDAPVGMTLVKESRKPRKREPSDMGRSGAFDAEGNEWFPGEMIGLFLMHRMEPGTPGTDDGWVYATTNAEVSEVIEVGMIESCIQCHASAPRGRLYGVVTPAIDAIPQNLR